MLDHRNDPFLLSRVRRFWIVIEVNAIEVNGGMAPLSGWDLSFARTANVPATSSSSEFCDSHRACKNARPGSSLKTSLPPPPGKGGSRNADRASPLSGPAFQLVFNERCSPVGGSRDPATGRRSRIHSQIERSVLRDSHLITCLPLPPPRVRTYNHRVPSIVTRWTLSSIYVQKFHRKSFPIVVPRDSPRDTRTQSRRALNRKFSRVVSVDDYTPGNARQLSD